MRKERRVYRKLGEPEGKNPWKQESDLGKRKVWQEWIELAIILKIWSDLWRVKDTGSERVEGRPENSRQIVKKCSSGKKIRRQTIVSIPSLSVAPPSPSFPSGHHPFLSLVSQLWYYLDWREDNTVWKKETQKLKMGERWKQKQFKAECTGCKL
jgi:hypothetical protein